MEPCIPLSIVAGGGLYRSFPHDRSVIRSCRFLKNKAGQYGGAIYEQNVADGLVQVRQSPVTLEHLYWPAYFP